MALNGALAGLVAITAEPLTPEPIQATMIGAVGGLLVVGSIVVFDKLRIDDPVGAISVHGVVGMWVLIAVAFTHNCGRFWGQSETTAPTVAQVVHELGRHRLSAQ